MATTARQIKEKIIPDHHPPQQGTNRHRPRITPLGVLDAWPVACLSECGDVLYVTEAAEEALVAVSDPQARHPIQRLDCNLLQRLSKALPANEENGYTTLFRRDGVISHYKVLMRRIRWNTQPAVSIFFLDAGQETSELVDEWWSEVIR